MTKVDRQTRRAVVRDRGSWPSNHRKRLHPQAKRSLHEMMYADSRKNFDKELARFVAEHQAKYPKAVEALVDDKETLLHSSIFPPIIGSTCARRTPSPARLKQAAL